MKIQLSLSLVLAFAVCSLAQQPGDPAHVCFFSAGYRAPLVNSKVINSGHGLYVESGLNAGKLTRSNAIVGVYGGWAFRDLLWSTSFSQGFATDLRNSINRNEPGFSSADSALIAVTTDLVQNKTGRSVPGCTSKSFNNYSLYGGVAVKLPYKWFPLTKIYMGSTRSHYYGDATSGGDFTVLQLRRRMYGVEIIFINSLFKNSCSYKVQLGAYAEMYNFSHARLFFDNGDIKRSIELRKYTSSSFINKYNNDYTAGLKISVSFM